MLAGMVVFLFYVLFRRKQEQINRGTKILGLTHAGKKFISVAEGAGSLCKSFWQRDVYGEVAFKMRLNDQRNKALCFQGRCMNAKDRANNVNVFGSCKSGPSRRESPKE